MHLSPEWSLSLQVLGLVSPAMQMIRDRGRSLSGEEFVDVAETTISLLSTYLLDDNAPTVAVFCLDPGVKDPG